MPSLLALSDEELSLRAAEEFTLLDKLRDEYAGIGEQISVVYAVHSKYIEEINSRKIAKMGEVPDWSFFLEEGDSGCGYKALNRALQKLHPNLRSEGTWVSTGQRSIKVSLGKKEPVLPLSDALQTLLPFVIPCEDEDGDLESFKRFSVTSDDLSYTGVLSLAINEEKGVYEIRLQRYGRVSVLKRFGTLIALLNYVQKEHSYC